MMKTALLERRDWLCLPMSTSTHVYLEYSCTLGLLVETMLHTLLPGMNASGWPERRRAFQTHYFMNQACSLA